MGIETQIILILLVFFVAAFVRSAFGFGDALIAMPLLAIFLDLKTVTPLVALAATTTGTIILIQNRRHIRFGETWRLIVSSIAGIPIGLFLLKGSYENTLKAILAVIIIIFAAYNLYHPRLMSIRNEKYAFGFGLLAGILGDAYNTNGPPVVIYGAMRHWEPSGFRATLQSYFVPTSLFILLGHALGGLWTSPVLHSYCLSLPVIFAAVILGKLAACRMRNESFQRSINILLIGIGAVLLTQSIHGF